MAPKKHNGFMMFVNEWRNNNAEGRRMTVPQAVTHCGELWKNMSAQERGPYHSLAKDADVQERCKKERLNCHGQALSAVEREEREAAEQLMNMKRSIERIVLKGKAQHDLENTQFMFAAFNYFTKAVSNDVYIPAEFAACAYSLKSGKTSIYSSHINPGQLIFGQGSDTQHHTSTTHQLPLPPSALGESDMGRLYGNIVQYLRDCQSNASEPLVVFTTTELMPVVKGCFRYLECDSDEQKETIQVYDIQYLFYILKKEVMEMADLPHATINKSITDTFILNDFFEYHMGISCQFHEDNDRGKYCTQSMVSRWSYMFSDYMCGDLAIKPLPGRHMPPKQEVKYKVTNPEVSSGNTSFASFHSVRSQVKQEVSSDYVPTDHTAFTANAAADFPSLGAPKSKPPNRQPLANANSREARNAYDVPALNRSVKDCEDAFNMSRR